MNRIQTIKSNENHFSIAAYKLVQVDIADDLYDQEKLLTFSREWHEALLHTINACKQKAAFRVRYHRSVAENIINVYLIISAYEADRASVSENIDAIVSELKEILIDWNDAQGLIYRFEKVENADLLLNFLSPDESFTNMFFKRNLLLEFVHKKAGFRKENNTMFRLSNPGFTDLMAFGNLLNYLNDAGEETILELHLMNTELTQSEIDLFKLLSSSNQNLDFTFLEKEEMGNESAYARWILTNRFTVFKSFLTLSVCSKTIPVLFKRLAGNAFYGNYNFIKPVKISAAELSAIYNNSLPAELEEYPLHYLTTLDHAADFFHFPYPQVLPVNKIKYRKHEFSFYPENLSISGTILGIKHLKKNLSIPVKISDTDFSKHIYLFGQTGVGKTTLLKTAIIDLIQKGEGVALIDPHGDLLESVMKSIPASRKDDVILIDPVQKPPHWHLNIIEFDKNYPEQQSFIFNELMKLFEDMYDMKQTAGPMFEVALRNSLLLAGEVYENANLDSVSSLLQKQSAMRSALEQSRQNKVKDFFENLLKTNGEWGYDNWAAYVTSKFNRISEDLFLGPMLNSSTTNFSFREIIDNKKILLVKMNKGKLGDFGVKTLGSVIFNRLIMAAYSRADINENDRIPFTLFVDEFQNFTSTDIVTSLAESRKYKLRLVLANQTLGQLNKKTFENVLGNVGNYIFFRPGVNDASYILPYIMPEFTLKDLLNLPNYQAFARIQVNNTPQKTFAFETKI